MMRDSQAVKDWLEIHRGLLDFESAFTDLAIRAAQGEISLETLDQHRARLMEMRAVCTAAYERAFPHAVNRTDATSPGQHERPAAGSENA